MNKFLKRAWAEIDLDALKHNYTKIKEIVGEKEVLGVVKANAYGHDDKWVGITLRNLGVNYFSVSNLWEGEKLRKNGITENILVFGYTDEEYFDELLEYGMIQTVGNTDYGRALSEYAISKGVKIPVHIKINTGMTRVGIETKEELLEILAMKGLDCKAAYTHFAAADSFDEDDIAYTNAQQKKLMDIAKGEGLLIHSRNSAGILYHRDFEGDIVRAGVILYGNYPNYPLPVPIELKQVMSLKSTVSQLKDIKKGTEISYGRTYTAEKDMKIAVIPIGYADGYMRAFSGKGKMLVNGVLCPVIGRVCMDQTMIDVSDVANIKVGDEVTVYGGNAKETTIDYNAQLIGTIGYELTCAISMRIPRVITENGKIKSVEKYC